MTFPHIGALILAAGKGTRMPSPRPKVLQTLLGDTMLACVHAALKPVVESRVWTLVGYESAQVCAELARLQVAERVLEQSPQRGTGHALQVAFPTLQAAGLEHILVVNGDVPLLTPSLLTHLLEQAQNCDIAFLTLHLPDPAAYGRVLRNPAGQAQAIVEAKDYNQALHGPLPHEINAGMYVFKTSILATLLPQLSCANMSKEFYITDLISLAVQAGLTVHAVPAPPTENPQSLLGVNTPTELAAAEAFLQESRVRHLLASGVLIHAPESVRVGLNATIAPGAEMTGPCEIYGHCHIGSGATIHSHCLLRDAHLESGCTVHSFSHIEKAHIGPQCLVGPYARLRPGADLQEGSHVGNFVELKKTRLGRGSKANHLSYLGDSDIGSGVNIGAGTITCNYDGKNKYKTTIAANAFIGSNTALVAPVEIGENALVGAGSVITENVPGNALAIARAPQVNRKKKS